MGCLPTRGLGWFTHYDMMPSEADRTGKRREQSPGQLKEAVAVVWLDESVLAREGK